MRTFKILFLAFLSFGVFIACEQPSDVEDLKKAEPITETLEIDDTEIDFRGKKGKPFKANFYTIRRYLENAPPGCEDNPQDCLLDIYEPVVCDEDPFLDFNLQCGGGQGTHLGNFNAVLSFCGAGFDYKNGTGIFVAANGDQLWIKAPYILNENGEPVSVVGHVIPIEHPHYEARFNDPFIFAGGTGRFKGATGQGMTDSYVDLFDDNGNFLCDHQTDHKWTGTLILP